MISSWRENVLVVVTCFFAAVFTVSFGMSLMMAHTLRQFVVYCLIGSPAILMYPFLGPWEYERHYHVTFVPYAILIVLTPIYIMGWSALLKRIGRPPALD
jgi:hypothetical protein